jgi:hypothetical protein
MMQTTTNNSKILFLTGSLLIVTITMVLVIASLSFFGGAGVASWQFPASFLLTAALYYYSKSYNNNFRVFLKSVFISLVIIIVAMIIAISFYDVSYDGQSYHQEGILQLREGWNPFKTLLPKSVNFSIYINHYSKGVELPQSTIYSLTNHIEAAKATNFILLAAAFCLTLSFLLDLKRLSILKCILISVLAVFNPIIVNQLISTYVDGQLAVLLLCFFIAALLVIKEASYGNLILLGGVIIIEANTKFTGLVYMVLFVTALLAWLLYMRRIALFKRALYTSILSGAIAVLIVGYNPYVVNTVKFQHPFYPLMGKNKVDIMGLNTPNGFEGKNAVSKFFASLFAHTDNVMPDNGRKVQLKIPFTINKTDIVNASKIDTRIAGFGPLFSGLILISGIALIILLVNAGDRENIKNSLYFIAVIIASVCIIPESWWARYIPQLWYVPIIILLNTELYRANKLKALKFISYAAFILNIGFTFIVFGWNMMMTSLVKYQMENLRATHQTIIVQWGSAKSNRIRFNEFHIPYIEKNLDNVPNTENLIRSDSKFVIPENIINIPKSKFVQWSEKFQQVTEK